VNSLHSLDFADNRVVQFLLTLTTEGVKTHSFFDSF
jgi:hypothetical protein